MTGSLALLFLLQLGFIFLNAVFASAEIAVLTMNPNKLAHLASEGDKRAVRLTELIEQPSGFLATIQVGITLINLLSSAVATENFSGRLAEWFRVWVSDPYCCDQYYFCGDHYSASHLLHCPFRRIDPETDRVEKGRTDFIGYVRIDLLGVAGFSASSVVVYSVDKRSPALVRY